MSKRLLNSEEAQALREELQAATLAALVNSRRWALGDIAFQGGTCLHLVYGSPRFSEDLDFLIRGGLSLKGFAKAVQERLVLPSFMARDLTPTVSVLKDEKNPRTFYVTLGGKNVIGSVKVKVELWDTAPEAMNTLNLVVQPVNMNGVMAVVPSLTIPEIVADKVYALGARERLKPRDIHDLWWLNHHAKFALDEGIFLRRLSIYPQALGGERETAAAWLEKANTRLQELKHPATTETVTADLARWLPSFARGNMESTQKMLVVSTDLLIWGMQTMQAHLQTFGET